MKSVTSPFFLLLTFINITSVFFLFQINIGVLPLIESQLDAEQTQKINGLVSDLSQGILISTFFYYLLVHLPAKAKAMRVKALIAPRLKTITNKMEILVLYLMEQEGLQNLDLLNLPKNAFDSIPGLTGSVMNFKYQVQHEPEVWTPFWTGLHTDIDYFENTRKVIIRQIDEILKLPHIADEDEDIVDLLPKIRDSQLFNTVECYQKLGNHGGNNVVAPVFSASVYDYYSYFVKLKKLSVGSRPVRATPPETKSSVNAVHPLVDSDEKKGLPPPTPPS